MSLRLMFVALASILTMSCVNDRSDPIVFKIVLPEAYVGFVRVDFGVDSAPPLKSLSAPVIEVGDDGRARTRSPLVITPATTYEFFYRSGQNLRPVPEHLVVRNVISAGGITARADDYEVEIKPLSWYFFVGSPLYRAAHPNSEFISHSSPLSTPGRMPQQDSSR